MNDKSKTMLAILAVALMVGTALVPLVGVSGEEEEISTTETNQVGLEELMDAVRNFGLTGNGLLFNGFSLVPVNVTETTFHEQTIGTEIKTTVKVSKDSKLLLGKNDESPAYVFGDGKNKINNGSIVVEEGGCIVLWPNENYSFSLENKNVKAGYTKVVKLQSGAYISIFGVTFKLLCGDNADEKSEVVLFKMLRNIVVSFATTISASDGSTEFSFNVKTDYKATGSPIQILQCIDAFAGTNISLKGNYSVESAANGINCSFQNCTIDFTLNDSEYEYIMKTKSSPEATDLSSLSFTLTPTDYDDSDGHHHYDCDITGYFDLKVESFTYDLLNTTVRTTLFSMNDVNLAFKGIDVHLYNTVVDNDGEYKRVVISQTVIEWEGTGSKGITLSAKTFEINPLTAFIGPIINITDFTFTVKNPTLDVDTMMDGEKAMTTKVTDIDFDMSIAVNMEIVELTLLGITLASTDAVSLNISSFSIGLYGTNTVKVTVGSFGTSAKFTSDQPLVASTLLFKMEVTNPTLLYDVVNDIETLSFDFSAELSTTFDGADRYAKFNIDSFKKISAAGVETAEIESVTLTNNIPFSKIIPSTQDMICDIELNKLLITENAAGNVNIHGDSFSLENNTINDGIADRYGVSANDFDLEIVPATETENTKFILTSAEIDGFVKNLGADKEPFSVTGSPAEIMVTYDDSRSDYEIAIENGVATFGKGFLPFALHVNDGVTFRSNGFSAMHFLFGDNVSMSGTITMDLADKVNPNYARAIYIGEDYLRLVPRGDGYNDSGGYALTFDLASRTGTIVAHDGWTLNSNPSKWTLVDSTHATFEFKKMSLMNVTSSAFYFSVQGGEPEKVSYGQEIDLSYYEVPTKTGKEFVGWFDGSQIYNSDAIYIMPARTVVMEPIFADVVTPTPITGETGAVVVKTTSSDSTAVAVKTSQIEGKKKVVIEVQDASVVLDEETVKAVTEQAGTSSDMVILSVQKVEEIYDSTEKNVVGENDLYNINLTVGGKSLTYSEKTTFKVTLNVEAEGKVLGFNVSYMDETYHTTSVNVDSFESLGYGKYDVTFTVNHFSDYIVEPIVEDVPTPEPTNGNTTIVILGVLTAAIVIFCGYIILAAKRTKE